MNAFLKILMTFGIVAVCMGLLFFLGKVIAPWAAVVGFVIIVGLGIWYYSWSEKKEAERIANLPCQQKNKQE